MPFLVTRVDGLPLEAVIDWIIAQRRTYKQARTLEADLENLQYLYLWADAENIDLSARVVSGRFFTDEELRSLLRFSGWRLWRALEEIAENRFLTGRCPLPSRPTRVDVLRRPPDYVGLSVKRNRLQTIHAFLEFNSGGYEKRMAVHAGHDTRAAYASQRLSCLKRIASEYKEIPVGTDVPRKGISEAHQLQLRAVIEPDHPDNPWEPAVRVRNRLIVLMLLDLGIRRGELLVIRTQDLTFTASRCAVAVHRRPDDPLDPRTTQPATKTFPRQLSAGGRLSGLLHEYITEIRRKLPGARRHPFLLVNSRAGGPLSVSSVNKLFSALRKRVTGLPAELTPHAMRHTWNDRFSEQAERKGLAPEREEKLRKHQMGWSPRSQMAGRYTRRYVEREGNKLSVEMQEGLGALLSVLTKEEE
ncbi:site-specific integrase [Belnapia sp. T18]|uniref:Site-specific integrase n=2 Tax=Belnapia arida TaxID=2804533 RepID=A0ABS1U0H9_9PROT|nr:site-specific integrase [Belnapia arida]